MTHKPPEKINDIDNVDLGTRHIYGKGTQKSLKAKAADIGFSECEVEELSDRYESKGNRIKKLMKARIEKE